MTIRIVIIEDEPATARNLQFLLHEIEPNIEVLAVLNSVKESIAWIKANNSRCDLFFMDIRLNDGISLDLFSQVTIEVPVIFVTAYNDYALQAFKANGIDYILKPFDENDLFAAWQRYIRLTGRNTDHTAILLELAKNLRARSSWKQSFLVHFRDKLLPLPVENISWFHSANDTTTAATIDDQKFTVDFTLEQLQEQLDPVIFFRVNRQFIVHRKAIQEVNFYFNGRLLLKTRPAATDQMLISKARVPEFKAWMNS